MSCTYACTEATKNYQYLLYLYNEIFRPSEKKSFYSPPDRVNLCSDFFPCCTLLTLPSVSSVLGACSAAFVCTPRSARRLSRSLFVFVLIEFASLRARARAYLCPSATWPSGQRRERRSVEVMIVKFREPKRPYNPVCDECRFRPFPNGIRRTTVN